MTAKKKAKIALTVGAVIGGLTAGWVIVMAVSAFSKSGMQEKDINTFFNLLL